MAFLNGRSGHSLTENRDKDSREVDHLFQFFIAVRNAARSRSRLPMSTDRKDVTLLNDRVLRSSGHLYATHLMAPWKTEDVGADTRRRPGLRVGLAPRR